MAFGKKAIWHHVRGILSVTAGTLLVSLGTSMFILPFDLVTGGLSGLAIILEALIPFEEIGVEGIITALTWGSFLLGMFFLGKTFAMKTLVSSLLYPIGVTLFLPLGDSGGFLSPGTREYGDLTLLLAAVAGGALVGLGCAITFLNGGSTGGTDVLALFLCKLSKRMKSSTAVLWVDTVIILLGVFVTQDLVLSLLGIISAVTVALVIDRIFLGGTSAFVAQIVTSRGDEISRAVISELERSTTILSATGGYSRQKKQLLTVSFSMRQYKQLMGIVLATDPSAFITVYRAHEIRGEGWTR